MCLVVEAHRCSLIGYLNPLTMCSILNIVYSAPVKMSRSTKRVFDWSAPLFFDWLSSQSVIEQSVQYLI